MNYKEQLNKARQLGLNILDLEIANEVEWCIENAPFLPNNDNIFEHLCEFVEDVYLKCPCTIAISDVVLGCYKVLKEVNFDFSKCTRKDVMRVL